LVVTKIISDFDHWALS